jgi:serine/threonine protein kinase
MPDELGKYELIKVLGRGGQGVVHLARDRSLGRLVAIKVVRPELLEENPLYVKGLLTEAQVAGNLKHENIATIYDCDIVNDVPFIAMELVDTSLQALLDSQPRLPLKDALAIASGALRGLEHCHKSGVIHRDIKPGNILLNQDQKPKLTDFGIAMPPQSTIHAYQNRGVGTHGYMSPEQITGKSIDGRCDVYAVGVVLYEMLTGSSPFVGTTEYELHKAHVQKKVPRMASSLAIPAAVEDIVRKAMEKNPDDRFETAAAMGDAIDAALGGSRNRPASRSGTPVDSPQARPAPKRPQAPRARPAPKRPQAQKPRKAPKKSGKAGTSTITKLLRWGVGIIIFFAVVGYFSSDDTPSDVPQSSPVSDVSQSSSAAAVDAVAAGPSGISTKIPTNQSELDNAVHLEPTTKAGNITPVTISWMSDVSMPEWFSTTEGLPISLGDIKFGGSISINDPILINWGDGHEDMTQLSKGSRELTISDHTYRQNGEYTGYIQANDISGASVLMNFAVRVENSEPQIVNIKAPLISLDSEATFEVQISDPGSLDSHSVMIDWGDDSGTYTYTMEPGETTLVLTHTYVVDMRKASGYQPLLLHGNGYEGTIRVMDDSGADHQSKFRVWMKESFYILYEYAGILGKEGVMTAQIDPPVGESLSATPPSGHGFHLLQGTSKSNAHLRFDLEEYGWQSRKGLDTNVIDTTHGGMVALQDNDLFVLGSKSTDRWSTGAMYDSSEDKWTYNSSSYTRFRLSSPSLTLMDNGKILITGGSYFSATGVKAYEYADIYDPDTQTFRSIGVNPLSMKVIASRGAYQDVKIKTLNLSDGRVLIMSFIPDSYTGGFLAVFDPVTETFHSIEAETKLVRDWNQDRQDMLNVNPVQSQDGRIFIGGSFITADLKHIEIIGYDFGQTMESIATVDKNKLELRYDRHAQITLLDGNILFIEDGEAAIFDGTSYRATRYMPLSVKGNRHLFLDSKGNVILLGSGEIFLYEEAEGVIH